MEVNGVTKNVHGTVMVLLADTLAAHQLGGFKIGVGLSLRKCRNCMATADDVQNKVMFMNITYCLCVKKLACICILHSSQRRNCIVELVLSMTINVLFFEVPSQVQNQQHMGLITAVH